MDCADQPCLVVGDDNGFGLRARERDIEHLLIDQIGGAAVGVNQDAVGGLALRGVGGLDIGMAQMGDCQEFRVRAGG